MGVKADNTVRFGHKRGSEQQQGLWTTTGGLDNNRAYPAQPCQVVSSVCCSWVSTCCHFQVSLFAPLPKCYWCSCVRHYCFCAYLGLSLILLFVYNRCWFRVLLFTLIVALFQFQISSILVH